MISTISLRKRKVLPLTRSEIIDHLTGIYTRKNSDYGNSAHHTFVEFGEVALVIRISDKLSRLESLMSGREQQVGDESVLDTLGDAITYLHMLVAEIDTADDGLPESISKARQANIGRTYELLKETKNCDLTKAGISLQPFRSHLLSIWRTGSMQLRRDLYLGLAHYLLREYERMSAA